jgi:putative addiction module component (TIGR02574 family)
MTESSEKRSVIVDAIAPKESVADLAAEWEAELARRAQCVRNGESTGKPVQDVFARIESRLKTR